MRDPEVAVETFEPSGTLPKPRDEQSAVQLSARERRVREAKAYLFSSHLMESLVHAGRTLHVSASAFVEKIGTDKGLLEFVACIPTMNVFLELLIARDRDLARPIDRNDGKDMMFMSIAVPYANVIVAETYWSHQVEATRLHTTYATIIETDATRIPDVLCEIGCL